MGSAGVPSRRADRARAWHRAIHAEFCDVFEPWAHGTVVRATAYPDYWDLNVVRVEEDPRMGAEQLVAFADEALDGLGHRRVDFEDAHAAQPLREHFEVLGWKTERLVWMRHESVPRPQPNVAVQEIPYDRANHLRVTWHREDFDDDGPPDFTAQAREAAERRGVQVLAAHEAGVPIGYSQLEHHDGSAEIAQVYVQPDHRGRGLGTALTCAAIHAAGNPSDLWIVADDEGRPKQLYTRLGFSPAWTAIQTLRLP